MRLAVTSRQVWLLVAAVLATPALPTVLRWSAVALALTAWLLTFDERPAPTPEPEADDIAPPIWLETRRG